MDKEKLVIVKLWFKKEEINTYGVEIRYPDLDYDPTLEESKKAYKTALEIKQIILNKLKF